MIGLIQWQSPQSFWIALTVLTVGLSVVLWLYRRQVRMIRTPGGWILPFLRTLIVGVLAVSLLRPAILTPAQDSARRVVAVLVDQSRSMSVVDTGRSRAELVRLAAALGTLSEQDRPSNLSNLRREMGELTHVVEEIERSRSEQRYALLAGRGMEAADAHLSVSLDELTRRAQELRATAPPELADLIRQVDGGDPAVGIQRVVSRIDQLQNESDERLYMGNEKVRQICADLARCSRIELVRRALETEHGLPGEKSGERSVRLFGVAEGLARLSPPLKILAAQSTRADFAAALQSLRHESDQERLAAIVIFTDGRRVAEMENTIPSSDVPIFVVSSSAPVQRDLSIGKVWIPRQAFLGQTLDVAVELQATGCDTEDVEVSIEAAGERRSQHVTINDGVALARMSIPLMRAGASELRIGVSPVPDEATTENNQLSRVVRVIGSPVRVALLSAGETHDSSYLRRTFSGHPGIELIDRVATSGGISISPETIGQQELVVLCDVPQGALDARQWDALNRLVNDHGGSVMIMTADPAIVAGYASNPLAAAFLPWRADSSPNSVTWGGDSAVFRIVPSVDEAPQVMRFWDESDSASPRWNDLPPVFRYLAMPSLRSGVEPLLSERDSNLPVLTKVALGRGRVLFLGLDEMWRWEPIFSRSGRDRFWGQLINDLVPSGFAATNGDLAFDADHFRIEPGEVLHVRARAPAGSMVSVWRGDTLVTSRPLTDGQGRTSVEATLSDLTEGDFRLKLTTPDGASPLSLPLTVARDFEAEMRDISGDETELRRLAGARGDVLAFTDVQSLAYRLSKLKEPDPQFVETRLWDSPYLFLFVLGCLGLEWSLRKRLGLV